MPYTKVTDIAYGRLQAPSLDQQEEFLVNFGMVRVARTKDALYMRGTDPNHHLHVTHLGPEKFVGFAFFVEKASVKMCRGIRMFALDLSPIAALRDALQQPGHLVVFLVMD
jgi:hypothetical protein